MTTARSTEASTRAALPPRLCETRRTKVVKFKRHLLVVYATSTGTGQKSLKWEVSDLETKYDLGRDVGDAELEEEDEEDHPQLVLTESSSLLQLPIQLPEEEEAAAAVASTDK